MTGALETLTAEHRAMWRLTTALEELGRNLETCEEKPDFERFRLILDYIDRHVDQAHQPKEEAFLYRALRARTAEADAIIAEFVQEHAFSPKLLTALRRQLHGLAGGYPQGVASFQESLDDYVKLLRGHMQREEAQLFPLARATLVEADWREIDAGISVDRDSVASEAAQAEFRALMARIANSAPAPIAPRPEPAAEARDAPPSPLAADMPFLAVRGLGSHYGRIAALRNVNLVVGKQQLIALVGANGAGKSTLLRAISGVGKATSGRIEFDGEDITEMRADKRVRLGICHVPEGRRVFGPLSVEDNLRLGAYCRPNRKETADDLERMYEMFPMLKEKARLPAGTLSGGQQQMLAIARALMARPRLLLLDEPSMGLAPLLVEEIFSAIAELRRQAMTILLVEQNAHAALAIADRAYVIETGEIVLSGSGEDLLDNERVREAYLGI